MLADDDQWVKAMRDGASVQMPSQLRILLSTICVFGTPKCALKLFEEFQQDLSEDFVHRGHSQEVSRNLALYGINAALKTHGKNNGDYGLPLPDLQLIGEHINDNFREEVEISQEEHRRNGDVMSAQLNDEQKMAFDTVIEAVGNPNIRQRQFFLDGPGGCGKTFVYNAITSRVF